MSEHPARPRSASARQPAEPPGGGRQDHDVMREAALRPIAGPASTPALAAIGGIGVPGHEAHPELAQDAPGSSHEDTHEPIPGEWDPTTLTHREPGAIGAGFAGANTPPPDPHWVDERTAEEHALEGGGRVKKTTT